jgi:hypothetical protein
MALMGGLNSMGRVFILGIPWVLIIASLVLWVFKKNDKKMVLLSRIFLIVGLVLLFLYILINLGLHIE